MKMLAKRLTAAVISVVMAAGMAISVSAECAHTTWSASLRPPYYERYSHTHDHRVGGYVENGVEFTIYKTCSVYNKYGQLYNVCIYCGKTMSVTESGMGQRHSVSAT